MVQVYEECCKNCLLSKDSIVSSDRVKKMIKMCIEEDTHFICHKASIENKNIMCHKFYDTFKEKNRTIILATKWDILEFIPQPESEKLPTYSEMHNLLAK